MTQSPRDDRATAADAAAIPNPAAAEMIAHLDACGIETLFDRLEQQQPQCGFGLRGVCCRMCQWGPCRISAKKPRGVCGRTMELVAMANLVRAVAAGAAAQMMHARELAITLRAAARNEISLGVASRKRLGEAGAALNVANSWTPAEEVAELVAEAVLDDLGRLTDGRTRSFGFAPRERRDVWEALDVVPRSAAYEIVESMHVTTMGACSDWQALFRQALRTSLAHIYTSLVPSALLSDVLFGVPEPRSAEINYGVLKPDHINVLVHGHSPIMLEKVLEAIHSEKIQALAREKGAAGIVVGGMCCTGHEALSRHGIPTVTGSMGQELVLGTGAIDAVVVDMQCVLPGMVDVAGCFGTEIVTTCHSNRIPGATHIRFDPEHPETLDEDAMRVALVAIDAYERRDRAKIHIPSHTTTVMTGFSYDSVMKAVGGARKLVGKLQSGELRGVVAMVGCTTPKLACETGHVTIARALIEQGVLVLTSGCSSHALLNAGLCSTDAVASATPGLRAVCEEAGIPPVLSVGSCADNTRIIQVFAATAHRADVDLPGMPFVLSGPELANEKTMGQMIGAMAHGITAVVGYTPQLPLAESAAETDSPAGDAALDCAAAVDFFRDRGLPEMLGARLLVQPDPLLAADLIVAELDRKREALGWEPFSAR